MITNTINKILELGEGQYIEFKESIDKSLQKEMVAFANASGGFIYIGITDDSKIKGINITNKLKSQIQDIARNCDPALVIIIQQLDNIIEIEVKEGTNKPYSCSAGFFMRMGANSQKMKRDEILALAIKTGKIRFDEQICENFEWNDFDNEKFEYYLKLANISNNLPREDILRNLRVLTNDGFTNAGALYFAKEPYKYIITSKIRCIHFNDIERVDILDKKIIDRGIIGNIEFAISYLKERVPVRYEIKDAKRKEFPEYPIEAYREAIVNAIIHFDYFLGDTIAIEKLIDKIIINNKGELLFPKEDFGNRSEVRNRLLADLLSRTIYMEKAGTGIKRVKDACKVGNNIVSFNFTDAFWITIYSNRENVGKDVVDTVVDTVVDNKLNEVVKLIELDNRISANSIAQKMKISTRTAQRYIRILKQKNIIKRIGNDKTGHWEVINK